LRAGHVLDTDVIDLGTDSDGVRLVVVVKSDTNVDAEKVRSVLKTWILWQRQLRAGARPGKCG
jgi:hypothetical protein